MCSSREWLFVENLSIWIPFSDLRVGFSGINNSFNIYSSASSRNCHIEFDKKSVDDSYHLSVSRVKTIHDVPLLYYLEMKLYSSQNIPVFCCGRECLLLDRWVICTIQQCLLVLLGYVLK